MISPKQKPRNDFPSIGSTFLSPGTMKRDIIENKDEENNMINDSFGPINSANTPIAHEPTHLP